MTSADRATFVIVGGGIAGVSCAESLAFYCPEQSILLITESSLIKAVTNLVPLGKALSRFDIAERKASTLPPNVRVIIDRLDRVDSASQQIRTAAGTVIGYDFLCLCTGARPRLIEQATTITTDRVIGIRDTESVIDFRTRIQNARRIALIGNGGIASEIAFEVRDIGIEWAVKDQHITSTFVDPGAAQFFLRRLSAKDATEKTASGSTTKRMRYEDVASSMGARGAALGPDWHRLLELSGNRTPSDLPSTVNIHYGAEVTSIQETAGGEFPLLVTLSNGVAVTCDLVVSATGVNPSPEFTCDKELRTGPDGAVDVDAAMQTSVARVYAAGDACHAGWPHAEHWFQMRLWTQARQMGMAAGKSMAAAFERTVPEQDFCFEFFGHVTKLFGMQVVLLGKYNGQGLGRNYEALVRITPDKEYIKFVLVDGKLQGAILIGETGLEETCENLLLNQIDLTPYGDDILNPDIDIEDYFD